MADEEPTLSTLIERHARLYQRMCGVFITLPIPIHLPTGTLPIEDCMAALERVVVIAEEAPMPPAQRASLAVTCINWLTAADLIRAEIEGQRPWDRRVAILLHMMDCTEHLVDLNRWISGSD
ncbi:hypothetical protein [Wenjunlia vitaminophila]|uniref:hypothetical protein n=1 Tax=Wenjunlia vitaminophila TaxID=76728 RepID=UPI0003829AC6|nr:hypothetical protein [Wenjunlia vitaminophila]